MTILIESRCFWSSHAVQRQFLGRQMRPEFLMLVRPENILQDTEFRVIDTPILRGSLGTCSMWLSARMVSAA